MTTWLPEIRLRRGLLFAASVPAVAIAALCLLHPRPALSALIWSLALAEVGCLALRPLLPSDALRFPVALAAGSTVVSLALALLAAGRLYHPSVLFPAAVLLAAFSLFRRWPRPKRPDPSRAVLLCAVAGLLCTVGALALAFLPPMSYDARVYHLALAERMAAAHGLVDLPENVYSHFPLGLELHYGLLLFWGGPTAPAVFHLILAAATVGSLLVGRGEAPRLRAPGALALVGSSSFWLAAAIPNVDMGPTLLATTAATLMLAPEAGAPQARRWLAVGLLLGGSLACKFSSLGFVVAPLFLLALLEAPNARTGAWRVAWMLPGLLLPPLPYLVRNFTLEGNPFFPLFAESFGSRSWTGEQIAVFNGYIFQRAGLAGLWHAIIPPAFAQGTDLRQSISMLFLVPPALLGMAGRRGRAVGLAACLGLAAFAWASRGEMRFLLPVLPLVALASAEGLARLPSGVSTRALLAVLASSALLSASFVAVPVASPTARAFLMRRLDAREFYRANRALAPQVMDALNAMPDMRRVLFVGDARCFGARFPATAPTVFDAHPLVREGEAAADGCALASRLEALDYSHIYYNRQELSRLREAFEPLGWTDGRRLSREMDRLYQAGCIQFIPLGLPDVAVCRIVAGATGTKSGSNAQGGS